MKLNLVWLDSFLGKAGFAFLAATLLLISFPRFISLYTLGLFLFCGLILWIINFRETGRAFISDLYLILPPLLYFIIQFVSLIFQNGNLSLLNSRLMFLLIPLFGISAFKQNYVNQKIALILKIFVLGISVISLFLVIRILYVILSGFHSDMTLSEYFYQNNPNFFSYGFSILEHPSYLSLKVLFALILIFRFSEDWKILKGVKLFLILLFSFTILMLASKAGMIAWLSLVIIFLIRTFMRKSMKTILIFILFSVVLLITYLSIKSIVRFSYFIVYTERGFSQKNFDWKNLDQRTREWYTAIELIKEKPMTGFGIVEIDSKMAEMYRKNGFNEEADLNLNAHNQFLEAQMTFGVTGTLSLLWMLLTPVIFRKRLRFKGLSLPFIGLTSFFLIFESMFNRQWGIMFFVLFYCMLLPDNNVKENRLSNSTNAQAI